MITANGLHFFDNMGRVIFALPMSTVRTAEHSRDIRDPSVGKKLLFGSLAGDRKQDFLTLTTETESMAEGIVFKVKQNIGTGMAAKINFYARKGFSDGRRCRRHLRRASRSRCGTAHGSTHGAPTRRQKFPNLSKRPHPNSSYTQLRLRHHSRSYSTLLAPSQASRLVRIGSPVSPR